MEGKPMFSLHKTRGGVHPPQCKDMRDFACTSITPPERVLIPLNMHIGAPAKPVAVSYTHLDVYKRQLTWLKVHLRGLNFSTRIAIDDLVINCALHDLSKLYMNTV